MPCRLEPWEIEYENKRAKEREESENKLVGDKVDELRELIIELWNKCDTSGIGGELYQKILKVHSDQARHRQDDLDRLLKCGKLKKEQMRKVLDAKPNEPLKPQLGFDPNKY